MDPSTTAAAAIDGILVDVGSIVASGLDWMGDVIGAIGDNPLLLLFALIPLVGLGIGFLKRIIN